MEPPSYYNENADPRQRTNTGPAHEPNFPQSNQNIPFDMQSQFGQMMWEAGSKQVKETFQSYGKIDWLREYFNVEPAEVRSRLLRSFIPRKPSQMNSNPDLYGPCMITLTMVALLLFNMKSSGYAVPNGTLMGTSMFTCFGAWLVLSGILYVLCFLFGAEVPPLKLLSVFGYSMTSHCIVLLLTSLFHTSHDHLYFLMLTVILCLPSAIRLGLLICMHARVATHRLTLGIIAVGMHMLLIFYLHFGFHVVVEGIDSMVDAQIGAETLPKEAIPLTQ